MMKIYAVQTKYTGLDDTVMLFTSKKKAIEHLNNRRANRPNKEFFLKEFEFYNGSAFEQTINLPF